MADECELVIGADGKWSLTIADALDAPITTYTGAALLAASCWRGDDQAELFAPTVTWIDPTAGTILMAIAPAQTAGLTPGQYDLMLTITAGAQVAKRPIGTLKLLPAPGTGTARPTYITWDECKRHAGSWAERLQRQDTDQTGFAEELADARLEFEDIVHRHYRGYSSGLGAAFGAYSPWTFRRGGYRDPWLVTALAANQLVITQPIKECIALMALAKICRRQIDPSKQSGYREAACYFAARADDIAANISCEIDTTGNGQGDVIIHLGTVDSLRG